MRPFLLSKASIIVPAVMEDSLQSIGIESEETTKKHTGAKKFWAIAGMTIMSIILAIAIVLLVMVKVDPKKTEEVVMGGLTNLKAAVHTVVPASEPVIKLGIDGGQPELDVCDGTWISQIEYVEILDIPSYSAHNGCGGDVILNKGLGDTVKIQERNGEINTYKVVDTFSEKKEGTYISDIRGHDGEMLLQTCYWDSVTLKFLMLDKVVEA